MLIHDDDDFCWLDARKAPKKQPHNVLNMLLVVGVVCAALAWGFCRIFGTL